MRLRTIHALSLGMMLSGVASPALAQLPAPAVEVGLDAFASPGDYGGRIGLAPRVTFNVDPRTSLAVRGDAVVTRRQSPSYSRETQTADMVLRRSLAHSGGFSLDGLVGLAVDRRRTLTPSFSYRNGAQTVTVPEMRTSRIGASYVMGVGGSHRVGGRVAVREGFEVTVGPYAVGLVARAGIDVPLGRYTTRADQRALIGSRTLRTGDHVWVTQDDGTVVEGAIGDLSSASIEVVRRSGRTLVDVGRAVRIDVPDAVTDGAKRGAAIGGVAAGALGVFAALVVCAEETCWPGEFALVVAASAGYGVGAGALIGALADSLHGGRRVALDRRAGSEVRISPVAGRRTLGLRAAIDW